MNYQDTIQSHIEGVTILNVDTAKYERKTEYKIKCLNRNQNINLLIKRIDLLIQHDETELNTVVHKSLIIDLARHLIQHYLDYNTGVQLNFWSDIKHLMSEYGSLHHSSPRYDTLKQLAIQFLAECTYERYKITEFYLNLDTITKTIA